MQERVERAQDQDLIAAFRAGLHSWTGRPDCSPEDLGQALTTLRAPSAAGQPVLACVTWLHSRRRGHRLHSPGS